VMKLVAAEVQLLESAVFAQHIKHARTTFVGDAVAAEVQLLNSEGTVDFADELHESLDAVIAEVIVGQVEFKQLVLSEDMHNILHALRT